MNSTPASSCFEAIQLGRFIEFTDPPNLGEVAVPARKQQGISQEDIEPYALILNETRIEKLDITDDIESELSGEADTISELFDEAYVQDSLPRDVLKQLRNGRIRSRLPSKDEERIYILYSTFYPSGFVHKALSVRLCPTVLDPLGLSSQQDSGDARPSTP